MGDVILSTAALDAILAREPRARITWVVAREFAELLDGDPRIEKVIPFDRRTSGISGWHQLLKALFLSASLPHQEGYDQVLDLHSSLRTRYALAMFFVYRLRGLISSDASWRTLSKPRVARLGYFIFKKYWPRALRPGAYGSYAKRVAVFAAQGNPAGARAVPRLPALGSSAGQGRVQGLICVMPGAAWKGKCLPTSKWLRVMSDLQSKHGGARWVILGRPGERTSEDLFKVARGASLDAQPAFRELSLLRQARLIAQAQLLIGNDTGMAHLAEALGTPVVTVFGPTQKDMGFGPWREASAVVESPLWCSPCSKDGQACFRLGGARFRCQLEIKESSIVAAALGVLRGECNQERRQSLTLLATPYRRVFSLLSRAIRGVAGLFWQEPWNWRLKKMCSQTDHRSIALPQDGAVSLVWLHAASAGELEMIWPVATHLHRSGVRLGLSVFSCSGNSSVERFRREFSPVYAGPSPWEGEWREFFEDFVGCFPSCFVTSKYEAWPELWGTLGEAGVPLFILNADDRPSVRFAGRWVERIFGVGPAIYFGTVDQDSRMRLEAGELRRWMAAPVQVTGDPRWDRVEARMNSSRESPTSRASELIRIAQNAQLPRPWLVVGSSWQEDLEFLLPALLSERFSGTLWVVPHTVKGRSFESQINLLKQKYLDRTFLTHDMNGAGLRPGDVVVVNELGVLVELYAQADLAWVGGGLSQGLHSVIEPAFSGVPIACGKNGSERFSEVGVLAATGQLRIVQSAESLRRWLGDWNLKQTGPVPGTLRMQWREAYQLGASLRAAQWILQRINHS
jgi:3-deoxy-D-manno-octulosonic-acid transferase